MYIRILFGLVYFYYFCFFFGFLRLYGPDLRTRGKVNEYDGFLLLLLLFTATAEREKLRFYPTVMYVPSARIPDESGRHYRTLQRSVRETSRAYKGAFA